MIDGGKRSTRLNGLSQLKTQIRILLALLWLVCRGVMIKFTAENPHSIPEVDGGIKRENLSNFILSGNWIKHPKVHMCEQTSPDDGLFLLICLYIDSWLSTPD